MCCLKLIWRILSRGNSLWVKWIEMFLLKHESFWTAKETASLGSWIWKKIIKYREVAKKFCNVEVGNGELASFWFDSWSTLGRLVEVAGERGVIDMGISRNMSVADAWRTHRRRRHRNAGLNSIEEVLYSQWQNRKEQSDKMLWRGKNDRFTGKFSTKFTWHHIRTIFPTVAWHKGIWFTHATPKYSFCVWLAAHNRLATGDRMMKWNRGVTGVCSLCKSCTESRDHLFFSCSFTSEIWAALARGLFKRQYTTNWHQLLSLVSDHRSDKVESFLMRYTLQVTVYAIWRERNGRRHDEAPTSAATLIQRIDKQVRNRITTIRR